jgi:hypothetical protein
MKSIYVIGFLGVSLWDMRYEHEHSLIKVGHVGIAFEDKPEQILGFHPTVKAIENAGGAENALAILRNRQTLEGTLQDDTVIFERAYQLSIDNSKLTVWQITLHLSDIDFAKVQLQALKWYNEANRFLYGFPHKDEMPEDRDNCATFPRRLDLPLVEPTGHLYFYIPALEKEGKKWQPKGKKDD